MLFAETLLLTLATGVLDYATGAELSVLIIYAFPIIFAAWHGDRRLGITMAIIGAATWAFANYTGHLYHTSWGYGSAALARLAYFVFLAIGATALRAQREADLMRIEALERTRQLEQEIVRTCEQEQARLGRDLHDGLCQNLAAIMIAVKWVASSQNEIVAPWSDRLLEIERQLGDAVNQARNLARGMVPMPLEGAGLSIALDELSLKMQRLTSINITFRESGNTTVGDPSLATQLFRIAQEALGNAIKHSKANNIAIDLEGNPVQLRLSIADDGRGLPTREMSNGGIGMATMSYRARSIAAQFDIQSLPGKGTTVVCTLPQNRETSLI